MKQDSMKRLILTIALVLGITAGAHSQFRWGASVGGNYNDLNFKQDLYPSGHHGAGAPEYEPK